MAFRDKSGRFGQAKRVKRLYSLQQRIKEQNRKEADDPKIASSNTGHTVYGAKHASAESNLPVTENSGESGDLTVPAELGVANVPGRRIVDL